MTYRVVSFNKIKWRWHTDTSELILYNSHLCSVFISEVNMSKIQLYSYWRSSCSWRVRIALNLKEMEYEIVPIHLVKDGGEQFSAKYTQVNPMNLVPSLKIDGLDLIESTNIINYLDETRPKFCLMPEKQFDRVKVRTICGIICSGKINKSISSFRDWHHIISTSVVLYSFYLTVYILKPFFDISYRNGIFWHLS